MPKWKKKTTAERKKEAKAVGNRVIEKKKGKRSTSILVVSYMYFLRFVTLTHEVNYKQKAIFIRWLQNVDIFLLDRYLIIYVS